MSNQPEALYLADVIEHDPQSKAHHDAAAACLRRQHAEIEALKAERAHSRARYERACALLHKIHALLYPPPVTLLDGRTMAFRPSSLDPHELFQELSDRIRALPDELAAIDRERGSLNEYGVITEFAINAALEGKRDE